MVDFNETNRMISNVFSLCHGFDLFQQVEKHLIVHATGLHVVATCMVTSDQPQPVCKSVNCTMTKGGLRQAVDQPPGLEQPQQAVVRSVPEADDHAEIFQGLEFLDEIWSAV